MPAHFTRPCPFLVSIRERQRREWRGRVDAATEARKYARRIDYPLCTFGGVTHRAKRTWIEDAPGLCWTLDAALAAAKPWRSR